MLIPEIARHCAVSIYMNVRDGLKALGTAFLISESVPGTHHEWRYIVTARHLVEQIRGYGADNLVWVRVIGAAEDEMMSIPVADFWFHPNDTTELLGAAFLDGEREKSTNLAFDVAVAICPHAISECVGVAHLQFRTMGLTDEVIAEYDVHAGDDVVMAGLFSSHLGRKSSPIVRAGIIAVIPEDPVATRFGPMIADLVEIRSVGGLSGSPVLWLSGVFRHERQSENYTGNGILMLRKHQIGILGLVSGHYGRDPEAWDSKETLSQGVAIVVPWPVIAETIDQEGFVAERRREERKLEGSSDFQADSLIPIPNPGEERISLDGVDPEDALRALLKTPPHAQTEDPA